MKMTKQIATLCLFLLIMAVGVFAFASCGDCDHEWGEWTVTKAPTCVADGLETRVCSINSEHTETQAIAKTGHNFEVYVSDKNVTCTTSGTETAVCKNGCGATDTRILAATNSHSFTKYETVAPTCTEDGYQIAHCDADRCNVVDKKIDHGTALGHNFNENHICENCNVQQSVIETWTLESKDGFNIIATLYSISKDSSALYITGKGEMPDFEMNAAPWKSNVASISAVYISENITSIGEYNFYGLSNATAIAIPEKVTSIGANAFAGCYTLPYIKIPASVVSIGASAFANCSAATEIIFDDGIAIERIEEKTFYGCFGLTSISIPSSVKYIGTSAFYNAKEVTEIVIPASVEEIATKAFSSCKGLVTIAFESASALKTIGDEAFAKCASLKEIAFPEALEYIGNTVFSECSELVSVTFATDANLKFIGSDVFEDCDNIAFNEDETAYYLGTEANPYAFLIEAKSDITAAIVPDTTVLITGKAFASAKELAEITLPFIGISEYSDEYKFSYIFNKIPSSLKTVTFTKPVNVIDFAFEGCKDIETIIFAGGITSVGVSAFDGCDALTLTDYENARYLAVGDNPYAILVATTSSSITEIKIHKDTTSIDAAAFADCTKLETVTVEDGNTVYTVIGNSVVDIEKKAIVVGTKNSVIPTDGKVIAIANGAFKNRTIDSIVIPEGIVSIGNFAFAGCENLTEVVIPASVAYIGLGAFADCSALKSITLPFIGEAADATDNTAFGFIFATNAENANSKVPASLKEIKLTGSEFIGAEAFKDCAKIEKITLPATLLTIGESAFENCTSLKEVHAENLAKWCTIEFANLNSNPTTLAHKLYVDNKELVKLIIPNGVTKISYAAFSGLATVTSISLPVSITDIEEEAFVGCISLKTISTPALGENANIRLGEFFGTNKETGKYNLPETLKSVTISGGTAINAEMFKNCYTLETVNFAKTIKFVGAAAFEGCTALTAVNATDIATWASIYFENVNANPLTFAHKLYINNVLAENIVITAKAATINNAAFSGCTSIKTVVIEDGVTTIADFAFINCTALTSVSIADSVSTIKTYAFAGCHKLASIKLPEALEAINAFTFSSCVNLQSIKIPALVNYVDASAFVGCDSLAEIIVDKNNETYSSLDGILYNKNDSSFAYLPLALKGDIALLDGLKAIDAKVFASFPYIYSITVPNSVNEIAANAFAGLKNLKSISLPFIGASADAEESKATLAYIFGTIPATLTTVTLTGEADIQKNAFAGCTTLTTVSILGNTAEIKDGAFLDCENLLTLILSKSVKSIGKDAFFGCRKLDTVYYYGSAAEWAGITLGENNASLTASRILFYSETTPETVGTHWHYNEEGKRVIW